MFEKLITNLKKSLSGQKSNNDDLEEGDSNTSDSSGDDSVDQDAKKKQMSMIIRVIVILGVGYMAVDHFILSAPKELTVEEMIAANAPRKKKKPIKKNVPPTENEAAIKAEASTASTSTLDSQATDSQAPTDLPPVENINIMDKTETSQTTEPSTASETSTALAETNIDQRIDQLIETADQSEAATAVAESTGEKVATEAPAKKEEKVSMADLIVQEDVYTPAPQYDQLGRGLVYNCKDKYWACIDKPAYVACNKNMQWNKTKGNSAECVVQNVYASDEDCAKIQKYNVSTNVSTAFCN
jgi:hypothetical protein